VDTGAILVRIVPLLVSHAKERTGINQPQIVTVIVIIMMMDQVKIVLNVPINVLTVRPQHRIVSPVMVQIDNQILLIAHVRMVIMMLRMTLIVILVMINVSLVLDQQKIVSFVTKSIRIESTILQSK
jgi:hypothetical protein